MKVNEIMSSAVELVPPDATVRDAATAMAEYDIGAILVGAEGERLQGILTDRDIILRVVVPGLDAGSTRVADVMSTNIFSCSADDAIEGALARMEEHQVRRLPVHDAEGRLVGIVARSDLTKKLLATGAGNGADAASTVPPAPGLAAASQG